MSQREADSGLDLEAIRGRCEAATPGPWTYKVELRERMETAHYMLQTVEPQPEHPHSVRFLAWLCGGRDVARNVFAGLTEAQRATLVDEGVREDRHRVEPDAEFIAHARKDVPTLLAEVARLRALTERREEAVPVAWEVWGPDGTWLASYHAGNFYAREQAQRAAEGMARDEGGYVVALYLSPPAAAEGTTTVEGVGLRDALVALKALVKETLLPVCQKHGGELWAADAITIESVFEQVDAALTTTSPDKMSDGRRDVSREELYRAVDFAISDGGWRPSDLEAVIRGCARDAKGSPIACCSVCGQAEYVDGLYPTETIDDGGTDGIPIIGGFKCPTCLTTSPEGGR